MRVCRVGREGGEARTKSKADKQLKWAFQESRSHVARGTKGG